MPLADIRRPHVEAALAECDRLGRTTFLSRYGFGPARSYWLLHDGTAYDSKAVLGVAHGHARPDLGPLRSSDFSGGSATAGALLRQLGFDVTAAPVRTLALRQPGSHRTAPATPAAVLVPRPSSSPDVVLVGCVKSKLAVSAEAQDHLYTSPLFRKRRAYALSTGRPWFVLSALHGLLAPDAVVAPYDLALAAQGVGARRAWAQRVAGQLLDRLDLDGKTVEVHAGHAYVHDLEPLLRAAGASVVVPLRGLTQGQHLAWYSTPAHPGSADVGRAEDVLTALSDQSRAGPCAGFPWGRTDLDSPGLYSWWVDVDGAAELSDALGEHVAPGLVYVGQAGASDSRSGASSAATLRSRIRSNHLGSSIDASTWRRTLHVVLEPDSPSALTAWMVEHLELTAVPVPDPAGLLALEDRVLQALDPPLNLQGLPETPVRRALRDLRRRLSADQRLRDRRRNASGPE